MKIERRFAASPIIRHLFAAGLLAMLAAPAEAQSRKELDERMERIERDMMDVQRLIYRGGAAPASPADETGAPAAPSGSNQFATIELRFTDLEGQMRDLTGRVETLTHRLDQLTARLEALAKDVEFRLAALERAQPAAAPVPTGPPAAAAPTAPAPTGAPTPLPGALTEGGPQALYDHAYGLLRAGDYAQAEREFAGLVERNPSHELAANAQYWLGETYYVRTMFDAAAAAFLKAYQNYPNGPKRPDSLLKLGMSLRGLGQKNAACDSFSELVSKYPMAPKTILDRAKAEQTDAGCR